MPTIKELRLAKGWSQSKLANLSGLSPRVIIHMEKGIAVKESSIRLVALALDIDPNEISEVPIVNRVAKNTPE